MKLYLMKSIFAVVTLLVASTATVTAATIQNFVILNSGSSLSGQGGVFNDAGRYYGSFSLDTSLISPTSNVEFELTSYDIFSTGTYNLQYSPGPGAFGTFVGIPETLPGFGTLESVELQFVEPIGGNIMGLTLSLIEPAGTFHGGVVLSAAESSSANAVMVSDTTGSAYIIDPAILTPEPGSALLFVTGIGLIACARVKRRAREHSSRRSNLSAI